MAKRTVLQMVQDILDSLDSDNVNSINDTEEALQVASLLRRTYEEIISQKAKWPHLREMGQLTASGDSNLPTHMVLADAYTQMEWVKYNKRKATDTRDNYEDVDYLTPEAFMTIINARDSSASDIVSVIDISGITLLVGTDTAPTYWTSFDDEYIVFDSYDSAVDTTLQKTKTQILAYKEAAWSSLDSFVPDLPTEMFSYFLSEATSVAWNEIKQAANAKEEQKSRRQRASMSRKSWRASGGINNTIDYGRK